MKFIYNKISKLILMTTLMLWVNVGWSQLTPGDIAIILYNADTPDQFAFVALVDIPEAESINFTDKGWNAAGSFYLGEGTITWTPPAGGIRPSTLMIPLPQEQQLEMAVWPLRVLAINFLHTKVTQAIRLLFMDSIQKELQNGKPIQ